MSSGSFWSIISTSEEKETAHNLMAYKWWKYIHYHILKHADQHESNQIFHYLLSHHHHIQFQSKINFNRTYLHRWSWLLQISATFSLGALCSLTRCLLSIYRLVQGLCELQAYQCASSTSPSTVCIKFCWVRSR